MWTFPKMRIRNILIPGIAILLIISGCQASGISSTGTPTGTAVQASPTPTIAPTSTTVPDTAIFVRPEANAPAQSIAIGDLVRRLAEESNLEFIEIDGPELEATMTEGTRVVVSLEDIDRFGELAVANPDLGFIVVGVVEENPGNLYAIQPDGERSDQIGFIAGYVAALITPDFRVGGIALGDDGRENAAMQGFLNGAVFYCGLCRPAYPPFNNYPRYVLTSSNQTDEISGAIRGMKDLGVETIFLSPGLNQQSVFVGVQDSELKVIGTERPGEPVGYTWVASISPDLEVGVQAAWEVWMQGEPGRVIMPPITITAADPEILSEGKLDHIEGVIADLASGRFDTGVDPQTGAPR